MVLLLSLGNHAKYLLSKQNNYGINSLFKLVNFQVNEL